MRILFAMKLSSEVLTKVRQIGIDIKYPSAALLPFWWGEHPWDLCPCLGFYEWKWELEDLWHIEFSVVAVLCSSKSHFFGPLNSRSHPPLAQLVCIPFSSWRRPHACMKSFHVPILSLECSFHTLILILCTFCLDPHHYYQLLHWLLGTKAKSHQKL